MIQDYSLLTHTLPSTVEVFGKNVHLDPRTCNVLQCFLISSDETIPIEIRIDTVIKKMIPSAPSELRPEEFGKAYEKLTEFMAGYPSGSRHSKNAQQLLSYEQDHALIVSAFRQAYGLDLKGVKALHWWEFLALLSGIPEDTRLSKVIGIRGMELGPNDTPEQRSAKIKAKTAVAIRPKKKAVSEEIDGEDVISKALSREG